MSDPTPPVPPAPPAPPAPPVPQYGEYAPGGYVAPQPVAGPPQPQPYGAASYPQQAPVKKRKTWDLVLTAILLVLGLFGMGIGVIYGVALTDEALLDLAFKDQGLGGFSGDVGSAPAVLIVSHVVLYLLALGSGIPLLLARKVAFWAPLAAGIIAAVFFWGSIMAVIASDPGLMNQVI